MDQLHLAHLVFLSVWLGLILVETVAEILGLKKDHVTTVAKLHFYVDLFFELPVLLAVLITGLMLIRTIPVLTGLHELKIGAALVSMVANITCIVLVILRKRVLENQERLLNYSQWIRLTGLGIPWGILALVLGVKISNII